MIEMAAHIRVRDRAAPVTDQEVTVHGTETETITETATDDSFFVNYLINYYYYFNMMIRIINEHIWYIYINIYIIQDNIMQKKIFENLLLVCQCDC